MGRALSHIWRIVLAYLISALVTGYAVYASLLLADTSGSAGATNGGFGVGLIAALMIAWFAAFPAALTVLLGEWRGWRMWWYYSVAGSLIGLVLGSLFQPPSYFPWFGLAFGVVSGGIFWSIAGRHARLGDGGQGKAVLIAVAVLGLASFLVTVPGLLGLHGPF